MPGGEVTWRLVELCAPGASVIDCVPIVALHPAGMASARLKVEEPQYELSLLLTVMVKFTGVPEATHGPGAGVSVTDGLACAQALLSVTCTVAVLPMLSG